MDRTRTLLFAALILLPLAFRITTAVLVARGDQSPERRAQVLEYFDEDDIERGRASRRAFLPGSVAASVVYWGVLGWLVFGGVTRKLADHAARRSRGVLLFELLLIAVPLFVLIRLLLLPITFYHGYHLEGVFGFRRLELLPWLVRVFKSWSVTGVTQLLVGLGFFWLVRRLGRRWLWPAIGGGAVLSYVLVILWPIVVIPLFYKVTPLPEGELRTGVEELARQAGVAVEDIRFIDQSRVSSHTNAFFVGIGPRRTIYLYDTLVDAHSTPEVLAVVGHEIGHWRQRHVLQGWALTVLGLAIGIALLRWFLEHPAVRRALRFDGPGDLAVVPLLWTLVAAVQIVTAPIENGVSRHFERQADRAALELTGDAQTFIGMRQAAARSNRSDLLPHPFVVGWYSTHPPAIERILAAERWGRGDDAPDPAVENGPEQDYDRR